MWHVLFCFFFCLQVYNACSRAQLVSCFFIIGTDLFSYVPFHYPHFCDKNTRKPCFIVHIYTPLKVHIPSAGVCMKTHTSLPIHFLPKQLQRNLCHTDMKETFHHDIKKHSLSRGSFVLLLTFSPLWNKMIAAWWKNSNKTVEIFLLWNVSVRSSFWKSNGSPQPEVVDICFSDQVYSWFFFEAVADYFLLSRGS